jgi:transposase
MQRSVENELLASIRRLQRRLDDQDALIIELKATIVAKDEQIESLHAAIAKLKKNSSTSSKPSSSDITKPASDRKKNGKSKRKIGGQPGHKKHERKPFPPEEVDQVHVHTLDACPDCEGPVDLLDDAPRVIQQAELREKPLRVDEYRGLVYWCENCQKKHTAPLPPEVERAGLVGPRLTAVVAYLKGGCHASFSTIRKYLRDVLGITISRGQLGKVVERVSHALEKAYNELQERLALEGKLNVDETGHKENGEKFWTWCFRAESFVFFKIAGSRGSAVLFEMLGREFDGILGCDYFSAYRKYMKDADVLVQFCLAHLIRDIRYLTTLRAPATVAYGERLLRGVRRLFRAFHSCESDPPEVFRQKLERTRKRIMAMALADVPGTNEAQNIAVRFRKHGAAYFQFITTPGIDPTNNIAEQAIRFVVIDRLVTQGTRSERGRTWCERIWTVMATCGIKGRSAFNFIQGTVEAYFANRPTPSLLTLKPALERSG